jgi:hypothetical protein
MSGMQARLETAREGNEMNRQQRRAQAKKGRVTPKKEKAPQMFADVTDEAGNKKRIKLHGTRVSEEEVAAAQERSIEQMRRESEAEEMAMRIRARVHGLWIPGLE